MPAANDTPTFNLKAVLLETGLKPDTLRAWERRYGLPRPERSPGGHRLYSQRDIEIIKWLMDRQDEGMSISRAVDRWRSLEAQGQDPLRMEEFAAPELPALALSLPQGEALADLRRKWLAACLAFDERRADQVLAQAFALFPPEVVCLELLQKGLAEVGEGWYRGEITVQQEHFTSELAVRRLEALIAAAPLPTRPERLLVACPPEEEHTFSPLVLTLFLRRSGLDVVYLGANVPVGRLEATVSATRPRLVIMAAQQLHTAATLLETTRLLRDEGVPLAYGGLVFNLLPELRERIPGYFLGESLDAALQAVEELLASHLAVPDAPEPGETYRQALQHFRERQAMIAADVWQTLAPQGMPPDYLIIAGGNLAADIIAGLMLGDIRYVGLDIEWVKALLSHYNVPGDWLREYLGAYYEAAQAHLDGRGAPILTWLAELLETDSE
jgi:DNA-binding transcriptional MerR regulator/methylmalonyl-CoA mutase cobalamin-binding subunit